MKKIMFNDKHGLTDAVLEGRKTMTRRFVNKRIMDDAYEYQLAYYNNTLDVITIDDALVNMLQENLIKLPYKIGEEIAIAQSYKSAGFEKYEAIDYIHLGLNMYSPLHAIKSKGWNNKMFVIADLMPHQIRITDFKLERLQDISDEDCLKEGIKEQGFMTYHWIILKTLHEKSYRTQREAFMELIDKVSGKGTWESNPWVFAYSFELVK